ncbi:hypothetical protein ACFQJ6_13510 [Halorussus caseinilyticus]|uniref:MarR family transcriptional regulator n=2 Tax=Halorussus caseinilyticus TaxID=3034025 RepID=A0ABD5WSC1_9EURY|nr:hypothetical protein [Halorussus sp. DT72]
MAEIEGHGLVEETELSEDEVEKSLQFLERQELVSRKPTNKTVPDEAESVEEVAESMGWEIKLTEEGFQVAHEREIAKREDDRNVAIVLLTFLLAGTSAVRTMEPIIGEDSLTLFAILVFSVFLGVIWKTDFTW